MNMQAKHFFIALVVGLSILISVVDHIRQKEPAAYGPPRLSAAQTTHILYGDAQGGGHLHGVGKPCKSEFPAAWAAEDIIHTIKTLAANDNINWVQADNGYHTTEQTVSGIRIRIVTDREGDDIVTAYPVNVQRNPCPVR